MTTSRLPLGLRSRRRGGRRLGVAAAAVVSSLLIASCGSEQAGAAATVGDRRISVASVQSGYESIVKLAGPDAGFTQTIVLDYLILEPYLVQAASDLGRGVSTHDAELQLQIDANAQQPSPAALRVVRALAANQAIRSGRSEADYTATYRRVSDRLKADGVHINPRFGAGIDFEVGSDTTLSILPEKQNWLTPATPAPGAATPSDSSGNPGEPDPGATATP